MAKVTSIEVPVTISLTLEGVPDDWTVDPDTGRSNSSALYLDLVELVDGIIRRSGHDLMNGGSKTVARLIMSQLIHERGMRPSAVDSASVAAHLRRVR